MEEKEKYIIVTERGIKRRLPLAEIVHMESHRVYTIFHTRNARQYVSSQNLGKVVSQLDPSQFLRIHKSHIVNLQEIKSCQLARGGNVTMSDNTVITVAQRKKTELLLHLARLNKKAESLKLKKLNNAQIIAQTKKR